MAIRFASDMKHSLVAFLLLILWQKYSENVSMRKFLGVMATAAEKRQTFTGSPKFCSNSASTLADVIAQKSSKLILAALIGLQKKS